MTNQNFLKKKTWLPGIIVLLSLLFLTPTANLSAQQSRLLWQGSSPEQFPSTMTALGDNGYLTLHFQVADKSIINPVFNIDLPVGVDFVSTTAAANITAGTNQTAGITYTAALSGTATAGSRRLAISITSGSKTLSVSNFIDMQIAVRALCGVNVASPGDFKITVSGTDIVMQGTKNIPLSVQKPTARMYTATGGDVKTYANIGDINSFALKIDAYSGYIKSAKVQLAFPGNVVTLSNFKLDGVEVPGAKIANASAGTVNQVTTITIDNALLGSGVLDATVRTLTFDATANKGCARTINTNIFYDATATTVANACQNAVGPTLTMDLPTDVTAPVFSHSKVWRAERDLDITGVASMTGTDFLCYDGSRANYEYFTFINTNNTPASSLSFNTRFYYSDWPSICAYYDTTDVYYRVTVGGVAGPYIKIPGGGGNYTYLGTHSATNVELAPVLRGKPYYITVRLPISVTNMIPAGAKVEVRVPFYQNTEWRIFNEIRKRNIISLNYNDQHGTYSTVTASNRCDIAWGSVGNINPYSLLYPRFRYTPSELNVLPSQQGTISNSFYTGNNNSLAGSNGTGPRYCEIFVTLPPWIDIDPATAGDIASAFKIGTTAPAVGSGVYKGVVNGARTYSVKYYTTVDGNLNIRYKTSSCVSQSTVSDTIKMWSNWISGDTPCRNTYQYTSGIRQIVKMHCEELAFVTKEINVFRQTRGYKDSNNDHDPDDGTRALDNEINHRTLLIGDTAYYYIKGYVDGSNSNVFDKLIFKLRYYTGGAVGAQSLVTFGTPTSGYTVPFYDRAFIRIKKQSDGLEETFPLTIPTLTAARDSLVATYDGVYNEYLPKGGDSVYIQIPFYLRAGLDPCYSNVGLEVLSYGVKSNNPTRRVGEYVSPEFGMNFKFDYVLTRSTWSNPVTYTFNSVGHTQRIGELYNRSRQCLDFPREVRAIHKPQSAVVRIPRGYQRTDNTFKVQLYKWQEVRTPDIVIRPVSATQDFATRDSIFTLDLAEIHDYDYNGSVGGPMNLSTGALLSGKYPAGDDIGGIFIGADVRATAGCASSSSFAGTSYMSGGVPGYANGTMGATTITTNFQAQSLVYTSAQLGMEANPRNVVINSDKASVGLFKIVNPGTVNVKGVWVYIDGNVKDVSLLTSSGVNIVGGGLNNCWLNLGNINASGGFIQGRLSFTYLGAGSCDGDTIRAYSVADFADSGFIPNTAQSISVVPFNNIGESTIITLDVKTSMFNSRITGAMSVTVPGNGLLSYHKASSVEYTINGKVSQGPVKDPSITISMPGGQAYDETSAFGKAKFEYPDGSGWQDMPASVLTALKTAMGDTITFATRTFTFNVKDLLEVSDFMLPGWGADPSFGFTDADRVVKIRVPFVSYCSTDMTGIRFRGTLQGSTACNEAINDNGMVVVSTPLYTDVVTPYDFVVKVENIDMTQRIFSAQRNTDTFIATFNKSKNANTEPMDLSDHIRVRMPAEFNINGQINSDKFGAVSVLSNSVNIDNERIIVLSIPAQQLNDSMVFATANKEFAYSIPVIFTPGSSNEMALHPMQDIEIQVITQASFAPPCEKANVSIGSGRIMVLTVSVEGGIFEACINQATTLRVTSAGVQTVWYKDEIGTPPALSQTNTLNYTPTKQRDTIFYVMGIYENEIYGIVPIKVSMNPRVIAGFTVNTVCEGINTVFTDKSTVGGATASMSNTKKWYWYLNGATLPFDSVQNPQIALAAGTHSVRLRAISFKDCYNDFTSQVIVYKLPVPTLTGDMASCFKDSAIYRTDPGMSDYTWTVSNGTLPPAYVYADTVQVLWNTVSGVTDAKVTVNYSDANGCRAAVPTELDGIRVRNLPHTPKITGDTLSCVNTVTTYSYVEQPEFDVRTFIWTVQGGEIVGGDGTANIQINWLNPGKHEITLQIATATGCNPDSVGILKVTINGPERPIITGTTPLCVGSTGMAYETNPGMSNYMWSVKGGNIISGIMTNRVIVDWTTPGTGKLAVRFTDVYTNCSTFTIDTFEVVVFAPPVITTQPAPNTTICPGNNVILSVIAESEVALSYQWYKNGTAIPGATINTFPASEEGSYSVEVKGCGSVTSNNAVVIVKQVPALPPIPKLTVCKNAATPVFTLPVGYTLKWYDANNNYLGNTPPIINTAVVGATTYKVSQVISPEGCESEKTNVIVEILELPAFTATNPAAVCSATQKDLNECVSNISAGSTVKFFSNSAATTEISNWVTPTATTTYYAQAVSNIGACKSDIKTIIVTVNTLPAAPAVTNVTYCQFAVASPLIATAAAGNSLKWYDASGILLSGTPAPNTTVAGATIYKVSQVTPAGCESPTANLTVTVTAQPAAPTIANPNPVYCQNATATALSATGTNLKWYDANDNLLGTTAPTVSTAVVGETIYKVSQSTAATNGCESPKTTITIKVNSLPTFSVKAIAPICNGESVNLADAVSNVSEKSIVKYYSNATATTELVSSIVTPTATTTYYAQAVNTETGCKSAVQNIVVTINALPAAPTVANVTLCQNAVASPLTATAAAGNSLKWYDASSTPLANAPTPNTSVAGTFTYKVSQVSAQGCEGPQASITVTITALPAAPTVANPTVVVCQNATAPVLSATGTNLKWYDANDNLLGTTAPTVSTAVVGETIYKVSQSTAATNGCESPKTTITIKVNSLPAFSVKAIAPICNGESVNLSDAVSNVSEKSIVKYYSNAAATTELTSSIVTPTATTTYYAQAVNTETGCKSAIQNIVVTVNALPAAPTVANVTLCQNAVASPLTATAAAGNSLKWYDASSTPLANAPTPNTSVAGTFTYKVSQVSAQGCESPQASITVTITALPAAPTVANPTVVVCQNATAPVLSATGTNLKWYDENNNLLGTAAPTVNTAVVGTTVYFVSQSTAATNGCESEKAKITVKVNELPTFAVSNPNPVCSGENIDLSTSVSSISAGSIVKYYSDATATTEISNLVSPTATSDYYIQSTANATACKSDIKKITVNVIAKPALNLSATSDTICLGASYNLASIVTDATTGSIVYYQLRGESAPSTNSYIQPATAGVYIYDIYNTVGTQTCAGDAKTFTLTVNELPKIRILGSNVCINSIVNFTVDVIPAGGAGVWFSTNTAVATVSNTGVVTGISTGSFEIIYRHTSSAGCIAEETSATFNVFPLPTVTVQDVTVCAGTVIETSSLVKTILNGDKYNIYTASTGGTLLGNTVTPAVTTTYYVESITTGAGCVSAARVPVTVNVVSQPSFTLSQTEVPVCSGSSVNLATLITNVNISNYKVEVYKEDGVTPIAGTTVTPTTSSEIYNIRIVSSDAVDCQSAFSTVRVNVGAIQYVSLTGSSYELCVNEQVLLTPNPAGSGSNIIWSSSDKDVAEVNNNGMVTAISGGQTTISYTYRNIDGCEGEGTRVIKVNSLPKLLNINNVIACEGETVMFDKLATTSSDSRVNFYVGTTLQTVDRVIVGTTSISYNIIAENIETGCVSAQQVVKITANAKPNFTVSNADICQGESIDLTELVSEISISDYNLIVEDAAGNALPNSVVTPQAQTTKFRVRVLNNTNGCISAVQEITITVKDKPILTIVDLTACAGTTVDLNSAVTAGTNNPKFFRDAQALSAVSNPATVVVTAGETTYYVQGEANGCKSEIRPVNVFGEAVPVFEITGGAFTVCEGTKDIEYVAPDNFQNYTWTVTGGVKTNETNNRVYVNWDNAGFGTISVKYETPAGCGSASTAKNYPVSILASPNPDFTIDNADGLNQNNICAGSELLLSPLTNGGIWKVTPSSFASIIDNKLTALSTIKNVQDITLTYSLKNNNGCTADSVKTLTINPLPSISDIEFGIKLSDNTLVPAGSSYAVCKGESIRLTPFNYTKTLNWKLTISDTETENTYTQEPTEITVNNSRTYNIVRIEDGNGCVNNNTSGLSALSINIKVKSPVQIIEPPVPGSICLPDGSLDLSVTASSDASDILTYKWTNKDGEVLSSEARFTATASGVYTVTVEGCNADSASVTVGEQLPLIVQKRNHTLMANNNSSTNGGFNFQYYRWYKNDELLWENLGGVSKGGYYYTGGANLATDVDYWVIAKDITGKEYRSCPFRAVLQAIPASAQAYPNPIPRAATAKVYVDVEIDDLSQLADATIAIYAPTGAYLGTVPATERITAINLPNVSGLYVLQFKSKAINKEFKIIVE